ncbi:MAG: hypothetical protein PF637_10230 [Spirochaetes bacterium]|jgi:hypothetical protein|nr:hypothetical protein [Spirochaetota bacterium]
MRYFSSLPLEIPYKQIYSRLGYSQHRTSLDEKTRATIDSAIRKGFDLCSFQGVYTTVKITKLENSSFHLQTGQLIRSEYLAGKLADFSSLILMGATSGKAITEETDRLMKLGNNSTAVIYDAVGSESTDAILDYLQKYSAMEYARYGAVLSKRRYSPGYGDISLEVQKIIYDILNLSEYGIFLNQHYQLIPEKSVLAIAGTTYHDEK